MQVTLPRDRLRDPLAQAKEVAKASRKDGCDRALVRVAAGTLTVQATHDTETSLTLAVSDLTDPADGCCLVDPAELHELLAVAPAGDVRLACTGDGVEVTTAVGTGWEGVFWLTAADPATFPETPDDAGEPVLECAAADLRAALDRSEFAAAKDEGKYAMQGVRFDREGKAARLVATDGQRLAVVPLPAVVQEKWPKGQLIVPNRAVDALGRLLGDLDPAEVVGVAFGAGEGDAHSVRFRTQQATLWARLLEGRFPAYRDVIPKKFGLRVPLVAGPFLAAVRQAAVLTDDESKRIEFAFEPGKVTLRAQGATTGSAAVPLALPDYDGGPAKVSFDPALFAPLLKTLDAADAVELRMVGVDDKGEVTKSAVFGYGDGAVLLVVPLV